MDHKTQKALTRIEELYAFSGGQWGAFEGLFRQNLDPTRTDEALDLLLRVVYAKLSSEGERYNTLLERLDPAARAKLTAWLDTQIKRNLS